MVTSHHRPWGHPTPPHWHMTQPLHPAPAKGDAFFGTQGELCLDPVINFAEALHPHKLFEQASGLRRQSHFWEGKEGQRNFYSVSQIRREGINAWEARNQQRQWDLRDEPTGEEPEVSKDLPRFQSLHCSWWLYRQVLKDSRIPRCSPLPLPPSPSLSNMEADWCLPKCEQGSLETGKDARRGRKSKGEFGQYILHTFHEIYWTLLKSIITKY